MTEIEEDMAHWLCSLDGPPGQGAQRWYAISDRERQLYRVKASGTLAWIRDWVARNDGELILR